MTWGRTASATASVFCAVAAGAALVLVLAPWPIRAQQLGVDPPEWVSRPAPPGVAIWRNERTLSCLVVGAEGGVAVAPYRTCQ